MVMHTVAPELGRQKDLKFQPTLDYKVKPCLKKKKKKFYAQKKNLLKRPLRQKLKEFIESSYALEKMLKDPQAEVNNVRWKFVLTQKNKGHRISKYVQKYKRFFLTFKSW
jgi:hypothetical protein